MWNNIVQYNIDRETSQKAYINYATIRLSRDTLDKLCKKCTLFESFVGCDAVFINLIAKKTRVL